MCTMLLIVKRETNNCPWNCEKHMAENAEDKIFCNGVCKTCSESLPWTYTSFTVSGLNTNQWFRRQRLSRDYSAGGSDGFLSPGCINNRVFSAVECVFSPLIIQQTNCSLLITTEMQTEKFSLAINRDNVSWAPWRLWAFSNIESSLFTNYESD